MIKERINSKFRVRGKDMRFRKKAVNIGAKVAETLVEEGMKAQSKMHEKAGQKMADDERKIRQYEGQEHRMSEEQREKFQQFKEQHEQWKKSWGTNGVSVTDKGKMRYGQYTYKEWDSSWKRIGALASVDLSPYNHFVGLYRLILNGKTVYIGRAVEYDNGGFRKRLSDYRRESDSARKRSSGRQIHENLNEIQVDLLIVGSTYEDAQVAKTLEPLFIGKYQPEWNLKLQ